MLATTSVPKQRYKDPASVSPVPEEKKMPAGIRVPVRYRNKRSQSGTGTRLRRQGCLAMQCGQQKPQGMPVTVAKPLTAETAAIAGTQAIVETPVILIIYTSITKYGRNSRDDETAASMPVNLKVQ